MTAIASPTPSVSPVKAPGYFPANGPCPGLEEFYRDNGFLVLEEGLTSEEVDAINAETTLLCRNEAGQIKNIPIAEPTESEEAVLKRVLCIHFPHKLSPLMFKTLAHPAIVDVLTRVVSPNVKCMQSMLFVKAAGKPGQAWHQDEDYIPTRDRSLIGVWIALDDATVENGCLWILPGSHRHGILWEQTWHGDRRFDCAQQSCGFPYTDEEAVPVEVKRGSIVFFHGYTLHRSLPNRSSGGFRRALVNHYMSAESFLPWNKPEQGVAMAKADFRDIVMVAGTDPFAYKGTTEINHPGARSDGQGGCIDFATKAPLAYKD